VPAAAGASIAGTTLLFFTESYPHDVAREQTFVEPQLPFLAEVFDRVVVIPARVGGARATPPDGIEVDNGLAVWLAARWTRARLVARALTSRLFWRDLAERPSIARSPRALKRLVSTAGRAELVRSWFRGVVRAGLDPDRCVAHTFWFDEVTAGLCLVKGEVPGLTVVSRANGADLFLERRRPPYIPCRRATLERLDRLYTVSEHGRRYAVEHYPWFATRCEVARLGVRDSGWLSPTPSAPRIVVASCSGLVEVKRVGLILAGVGRAARRRPDRTFEWHHFGDGDEAAALERQAREHLPANATAILHGHRPTDEIMRFYRDQPVAVFINASSSEGGSPVAIMEAASCGIPIVATDVGGNPEIVSERNGTLVPADAKPDAIADGIMSLIDDPEMAASKRQGSRHVWAERFVADVNYRDFAERLARLRAS
jgi:glycosyltransferase involved in cell wall biosynthesis